MPHRQRRRAGPHCPPAPRPRQRQRRRSTPPGVCSRAPSLAGPRRDSQRAIDARSALSRERPHPPRFPGVGGLDNLTMRNGQSCFFFSHGCTHGCKVCDGKTARFGSTCGPDPGEERTAAKAKAAANGYRPGMAPGTRVSAE